MTRQATKFFATVNKLQIDLKTDRVWAPIADYLSAGLSKDRQIKYWLELDAEFKKREKLTRSKYHKGLIYFKLAILHLSNKTLKKCLKFLQLSKIEDHRTFQNNTTASFQLEKILRPLENIVREKSTKIIFEALSSELSEDFFNSLKQCHDYGALGQIYQITLPPDEWLFVSDERIRKVVSSLYFESLTILANNRVFNTFYSVVFNLGCIIDGLIDDIFTRNDQEVWNQFRNNKIIMENHSSDKPMNSIKYPNYITLDKKIEALEALSIQGFNRIPKTKILQMRIINNFRNLIHSEKIVKKEYAVNFYIANFLFTFIAHIAHDLWPENFDTKH